MSDLMDRIQQQTSLPVVLDLPEDFDGEKQNFFSVMDLEAGDYKVIWDRNNEAEVEEARATFERLRKKGYMAYKVTGKDGSKGEAISEFDPEAERLIMSPALQGG